MDLSSAQLKGYAKDQMRGNYGLVISTAILFIIIWTAISMLSYWLFYSTTIAGMAVYFVAEFILSVLLGLLATGVHYQQLGVMRGREIRIEDLFYALKHQPDRFIVADILKMLQMFVWLIPAGIIGGAIAIWGNNILMVVLLMTAIIIGMIKIVLIELQYSQANYLLLDQSELSGREALRKSKELMNGYKGKLFYLEISFLGVAILGACSLYIGFLWIVPYMNATFAGFYLNRIGEIPVPQVEEF